MKTTTLISGFAIALIILVIYSCDEKVVAIEDTSSFGLIQTRIFNTSCAIQGCHLSEDDPSYLQHGLILREGVAYNNLVNVDSRNSKAHTDGLKRVSPGNPEGSLLLKKISWIDSVVYGNQMPLGLTPLSAGQVEFISTWIKAGAPRNETVCTNVALLDDNVSICEEDYTNLAPPENGRGYQINVHRFEVPADFEREIFLYKELGNEEEFFLKKVEMRMRTSSHHVLVNTFKDNIPATFIPTLDSIRDLRDPNGKIILSTLSQMEYQIPTLASQTSEFSYEFPDGVGLRIPAHHKLDINLHYVNKGTVPIPGECSINFYKADPSDIVHEAKPIFFSHQQITLRPKQKSVLVREFFSKEPMNIIMLTSHTHKLGEYFEIQIAGGDRDGEVVYVSSDWHHPVIKTFDSPLQLKNDEGLRLLVTYNNTTEKVVSFGLSSEDEMAIIYGYYY